MYKILNVIMSLISLLLISCASESINNKSDNENNQSFITGQIIHSGETKIPENAQIIIQLNDVSLMDVASITMGKQQLTKIKQFPVSFKIPYNPKEIKKGMSYNVSARIEKQGQLLFINDTHIPAFDDSNNTATSKIKLPVIKIR